MRRQFCKGVLGLGLLGALGAPAAAQNTREIKIATIALANSPWHVALNRFKQVVEERSKGRFRVSVYTDGQLGDIAQLLSAMQLGTIEFSAFGLSSISFVRGGEALGVIYVPYLFKSPEWAERVLNDEEFRGIYDRIARTAGVRTFGAYGQRSPRALQTTRGPITAPGQVAGLRLRIPPIPVLKDMFEKLGAQVTPMGMLEIYNALSRGTIDGQDNGFDLSIPAHYHDSAKFWSATDHVYELVGFFSSERFWRGLDADDKAMFEGAAREAGQVITALTRKLGDDGIQVLQQAGVTYSVPDRAAFRAAVAGIEKPYDGKLWPGGLVDRIREAQAGA